MKKKKIIKGFAVYFALSILFQAIAPTVALALTNGPSQPEMESFEPIGTTEMVDPFTGDFNYNLPLMTVPGPNGGYPINLAYHAGIGMEQEASWVGLGWNINAGEINRQLRGLPDDFNGDLIGKVMYMKPNRTASLGIKGSLELVSLDADKGGVNISASMKAIWNSYKGIGFAMGNSVSKTSGKSSGFSGGISSNYSSMSGDMTLTPSLSYSKTQGNADNYTTRKGGLSFSYSSTEGAKQLSFSYSKGKVTTASFMNAEGGWDTYSSGKSHKGGAGVSFSSSSYVPHSEMPQSGFSIGCSFDTGIDTWMFNPYVGGEVFYSQDKIKENDITLMAYGYMYSENRKSLNGIFDRSVMDFNREKDAQLTKDIPAMPMPVFTNDIYFVKGQGVGGAFRPYRSDIGILHDPVITSKNIGGNLGIEVGIGNTVKVATDITLSYSKSYSGPWRDKNTWSELHQEPSNPTAGYEFMGKYANNPLYEPFYFRNAGDMTANYNEANTNVGGTGSALPISMGFGISIGDFANPTAAIEQPLADVKVTKGSLAASKFTERASRSQTMSYKTNDQLLATTDPDLCPTFWSTNTIFDINSSPRLATGTDPISLNSSSPHQGHHIGEVTVINPDGNRYIYGIAAYNKSQTEVSFSVDGSNSENVVSSNNKLVNYVSDDISQNNNKGDDNFYSYKILPEYAHSYLLTAIVSPDYVDLTGNGLTEDDYGYYVKFNYSKLKDINGNPKNYAWRSPFTLASYINTYYSVTSDDKAGYTYGTKEIWYLNSIETKTHIAEITLGNREDGYGAKYMENGATASPNSSIILDTDLKLKKIEKIDLYSKSDPNYASGTPTPIKTVHFEYSYDLCGNVQNNVGGSVYNSTDPTTDVNQHKGKLTLKKVWFSHLNNNKGELSPYVFDYNESDPDENPDFSTMQMDRWGNYKAETYNVEDPYTNQKDDYSLRDKHASAWCLKAINLPSGGKIKVGYESDDYAYVQDQPTMQMAKILGTGGKPVDGTSVQETEPSIKGDELYVYFELKNQNITSNADVFNYVKNIKDLYFKTYQKLKRGIVGGDFKYDYVTGYAKVAGSNSDGTFNTGSDVGNVYGLFTTSGIHYGYLRLAKINVHDKPALAGLNYTNPFRKAGWQYLKINRTDLLYPSSSNNMNSNPTVGTLMQLANSVVGYFASNIQLFAGYYNFCQINNFCSKIKVEDTHPSFIRVNTPDGKKYGGGYRVKSIAITNSWTGLLSDVSTDPDYNEYGQEYTYRMPDGTSSGVAEYEPLIGGEEISLRKPIRYSSDYLITKHDDLYMEEPYCESYYPAASVGYSRIIVKGIDHGVTKGTQGINVYEYYTAKDFPVLVTPSQLKHEKFTPDLSIPFVGDVSFENHGFSQMFTVETNDMHGKAKSQATYPYGTDLVTSAAVSAIPVSKTEYIYNTDAPYSASTKNHLKNEVDVLYNDAYYKKSNLGLTKEFFIDMRERSNVSMVNGGQINLEVSFPPPVPVFSFIPAVSYSEQLNKMVVGMNVISRNGILTETRQSSDGATAITKNLMFDAATGKPLLTQVMNDFDKPVYSYSYAAQWAYDGMGAAYKNIGATMLVDVSTSGSGTINGTLIEDNYLLSGDEVLLTPTTSGSTVYNAWVTNVTSTGFTLTNKTNTTFASTSLTAYLMTIMRSGRRNQLSVSNGQIVSLSNPVTDRKFSLFDAFNTYVDTHSGSIPTSISFVDCSSGVTITATVSVNTGYNTLGFTLAGSFGDSVNDTTSLCGGTPGTCKCDGIYIQFPSGSFFANGGYHLKKIGNKVIATETGNPASTSTGVWNDPEHCLKECMEDVLHAGATELVDKDWQFNYADVMNNQYDYTGGQPTAGWNDYATGVKGIWRVVKNDVYQVDRKRVDATNIAKDGVYQNFSLFDWQAPVTNTSWTWVTEVMKYNPYGFETENKDALGIYSTALYGYDNSVQTAIANNSSYYETAFDGMEDYKNNVYVTGHGHGHSDLTFTGSNVQGGIVANGSHSGKKCIAVEDGTLTFNTTSSDFFKPIANKKYIISAWFNTPNGGTPTITMTGGVSNVSSTLGNAIEGWRKCDVVFTATSTNITFTFGGVSLFNLDDIRIQPFQSSMKTFVYNPQTLWLVAELDNQNYATFYNYDESGTLVQVKKETVKGVSTLKTTRSNLKRIP